MVAPIVYVIGLGALKLGHMGYKLYKANKQLKRAKALKDLKDKADKLKKTKEAADKAAKAKKKCTGDCAKPKKNPCAHLAKGDKTKKHRGGSYGQTGGSKIDNTESHHMPAKSSYPKGSSESQMPAVRIDKGDHSNTASHGSQGLDGIEYRGNQAQQIADGQFRKALADDIRDLRQRAADAGDSKKYNEAIQDMLKYYKCLRDHGIAPE
jgi:Sec-independent protein translocase protein TatA